MSTETKAPPTNTVTLTIDDQQVTVPKGTLVIQAAKAAGIDIPYLCYYEKLTPFGGCRLCLVEIEKIPKLVASCNTPAADGMIVRTTSPKIQAHREGTLEFILVNHPLDCPVCDKGGECELQDRVFQHGPTISRMTEPKVTIEDYDLGPLILRNQDRCIICKRCIKVMEEIVGDPVLEFGQRGVSTEVYTFEHEHFPAGFSGNTIKVCPVGALMSKPFRFKSRPWELVKTPSICSHCGVGCSVRVDMRENKIMRVVGLDNPDVNDGWLCDRGQFGYDYVNSPDRLRTPLIRRAGSNGRAASAARAPELEQASWEEAIAFVAERLGKIKSEAGPGAIGGIGGEWASNEDQFVFQKFLREVIGTPNVDLRLGYPTERSGASYAATRPGPGAIASLPKASVVLLFASDLTAEAPVLDLVLKRGLLNGKTKLIVANPRRIALSKFATQWLRYRPGTELALLVGLAKATLEGEHVATEWLNAEHRAEFESMQRQLAGVTVAQIAEVCGVPEAEIRKAATAFGAAALGSIVFGRGAAEGAQGPSVHAGLLDLALLTGQVTKEHFVFLEAVEECNSQGARDMGLLPDSAPGYTSVTPGLSTTGMLDAAAAGTLRALYVMGANPLAVYPDAAKVERALKGLELLIVQDLFLTETAEHAHVVLPTLSVMEKNGTLTNVEGRVQRIMRAMDPVGAGRNDWAILNAVAAKLGQPMGYGTVETIVADIRKAIADGPLTRGSKTFTLTGIEWDDQGEQAEQDEEASGSSTSPPHLLTSSSCSFALISGRLMFDRSTVQVHSTVLPTLAPDPFVELNPADATALGLEAGARVAVQSPHGRLELTLRVSEDTPAGAAFIPRGYNTAPVNRLQSDRDETVRVTISKAAGSR